MVDLCVSASPDDMWNMRNHPKLTPRISSSFPVEQLGARKTVLLTRGTQNYTLAVVLLVSHLAPEDQRSWKRQGT